MLSRWGEQLRWGHHTTLKDKTELSVAKAQNYIGGGDTAQKKIAHSDKATYMAAVCKFMGGHFFFWFGLVLSVAQLSLCS